MKMLSIKLYLFLSGMTLLAVGFFIGLTPENYLQQFSGPQINIPISINLFSELRGMGGSLSIYGLIALLGIMIRSLRKHAIFLCALVFSSFATFRILSLLIDGIPDTSILIALSIELVLAVAGLCVYFINKKGVVS